MSLYRSIHDFLNGKNTTLDVVDNGHALTITPNIKPSVPLGFKGISGTVQFAVIPDDTQDYADVTIRIPLGMFIKKRVQLS